MKKTKSHTHRHHYRVYGLVLAVNIQIPALHADAIDGDAADIEITLGFIPNNIEQLIAQPAYEYFLDTDHTVGGRPHLTINTLADGDYFHFNYEDCVDFICNKNATSVWGTWTAPIVLDEVALYLLGPIIGFMLRLRGITCLHASGIMVEGKAIALTGPSGSGKSTLAASFAAAGNSILTDDILPLVNINDLIQTQSGYSRLRLFSNSFKNLKKLPNSLPSLAPGWEKYYLDLSTNNYKLHKAPATLEVIYILDWATGAANSPSITTLPGARSVPLLAANTYRNELLTSNMRMTEFIFLSNLANKIIIKKVHPTNNILAVPSLCQMILDDAQREIAHHNEPIKQTDSLVSQK